MRKFTAFLLFIIFLFVSMALLGLFLKDKLFKNSVDILNATIDLYQYKYGKDEKDNHPYQTIYLDNENEILEITTILDSLSMVTHDKDKTLKENNCVITVNYKKSTFDNLYTDTYEVWYENSNQTKFVFKKGFFYYELPDKQNNALYQIIIRN